MGIAWYFISSEIIDRVGHQWPFTRLRCMFSITNAYIILSAHLLKSTFYCKLPLWLADRSSLHLNLKV